jgi:hypothetical protein
MSAYGTEEKEYHRRQKRDDAQDQPSDSEPPAAVAIRMVIYVPHPQVTEHCGWQSEPNAAGTADHKTRDYSQNERDRRKSLVARSRNRRKVEWLILAGGRRILPNRWRRSRLPSCLVGDHRRVYRQRRRSVIGKTPACRSAFAGLHEGKEFSVVQTEIDIAVGVNLAASRIFFHNMPVNSGNAAGTRTL